VQFTRHSRGLLATVVLAAAALAVPSAASAAVPAATPGVTPAVAKKLTPAQLAAASKAAFLKARSVRVRGVATVKGVKSSVDIHAGTTTCDGVVNMGPSGVIHLIRIDTKVWFTGDAALWKTAGIDPVAAQGMWAATDVNDKFWQPLILLCSIPVEAELAFPKGLKWVATKKKVAVIDKIATTPIAPVSPKGIVSYIAAKGTPLVTLETTKVGWTKYQEWNKPLNVAAPAPETVLP
jgi:hypothetical protein